MAADGVADEDVCVRVGPRVRGVCDREAVRARCGGPVKRVEKDRSAGLVPERPGNGVA